jgi:hypothetical protein
MRISLDRIDSDQQVTVAPGDCLVLRLAEQGSTGFVWMIDELPEGTQVAVDDIEFAGEMRPGASSLRRLELHIGDVAGEVVLTKRQPWQAGSEVDRVAIAVRLRQQPHSPN